VAYPCDGLLLALGAGPVCVVQPHTEMTDNEITTIPIAADARMKPSDRASYRILVYEAFLLLSGEGGLRTFSLESLIALFFTIIPARKRPDFIVVQPTQPEITIGGTNRALYDLFAAYPHTVLSELIGGVEGARRNAHLNYFVTYGAACGYCVRRARRFPGRVCERSRLS